MERNTRQRDAVRAALAAAARPLTPQELQAAAHQHASGIGIATVYRTIKALLDDGQLVEVPMPGAPSRYELAGLDHHHHFHCTTCDRMFEVEGCVAGSLRALLPRGFKLEHHELLLSGRCPQCAHA
jgi:Fur family transcriptional regulator, ferric uptake regulator